MTLLAELNWTLTMWLLMVAAVIWGWVLGNWSYDWWKRSAIRRWRITRERRLRDRAAVEAIDRWWAAQAPEHQDYVAARCREIAAAVSVAGVSAEELARNWPRLAV